MNKDKAMQQALELIERLNMRGWILADFEDEVYATLNSLKAALEQPPLPVQEPTPWRDMVVVSLVREGINKHKARELADHFAAQPVQQAEPVACRFCFSEKGCWTWQCHNCGEIDDVQKPASSLPVQPEPLEYWNAVEGWVKIDEVREHFDAVNCGTIYKHAGEGRVLLRAAPPKREWKGLTEQERNDLEDALGLFIGKPAFDAIEASLKERNT